jgi:hypothetical protein
VAGCLSYLVAGSASRSSGHGVFLGSSDFSDFASVRLTSDGGYVAVGTAEGTR